MEAVKRYDPAAGVKFFTYAESYIRKSIYRYYDRNGQALRLPAYMRRLIKEYTQARERLLMNGKATTIENIETLSLSLSDEYENLVGREIGYVLSKDYWGKGLMPEAVNRVIKFCFIKENTRITRNGDEHISLYYVLDNPLKMK